MNNRYVSIAVELLGSQSKLARASGYSRSAICLILHGKRKVTAEMALAIERATSGEVTRMDLRPDLFRQRQPAPAPRLVPPSVEHYI